MNELAQNQQNPIQKTDLPTLISFPICPFVMRSVILLNVKKQPFERIDIDLANKPQWFLDMVPTGRVPALVEHPAVNGKTEKTEQQNQELIFESAIINEYLDESYGEALMPAAPLEKARHRSWIAFSESLIFLQFKLMAADKQADYQTLSEQFLNELLKLEASAGKPYFDGKTFSLVDAALAPVFVRLKWLPLVEEKLTELALNQDKVKTLVAWVDHLIDMPEVKNSVASDFDERVESFFESKNSYALKQALAEV